MFRIMKYLSKAEIGQMLIALVTIVGQVYFDLKLPDYMSDITTLVETPGSDMKDIWIAGGKMLLISLGSAACAIITGYIAARVAASFTQRLRSLEFRKVESFGPAEMSKFSTASLITRSTNDVTQVQMFITMGLQLIVKSPIMAVWAVCKIAGEGFEWTLATGIAVVILLAAIVIMMAMVMPKFKVMQTLTDNINLVARENLTGLRVVRAYNAEDYQEAKFTKANKDLTETQLFTNRVMAFMMPLMNTIMNGLMLAVYWIGAYLIDAADAVDKLTTFSNMVVFSSYSIQVIMSFLLLSMVFVLWPRADVSAQRIMEVLDTEPIVENGTKTAADVAKTGQRGTVEFRNVSFTYPDSREAMLEGINFTAEQGQTVAFIGSTGSGKTTIMAWLLSNVPNNRRLITIEEGSREFDLVKRDAQGNILNSVVHLLTRPSENPALNINQDFLLERVLRKHPDVIGVGEMRSAAESLSAAESSRTGHTVCTTIHSNSCNSTYRRMMTLAKRKYNMDDSILMQIMVEAYPIIVFTKQLEDRSRKIMEIIEGEDYQDGRLIAHSLYKYEVEDNVTDDRGETRVVGHHKKIGLISDSLKKRLLDNGISNKELEEFMQPPKEVG